MGTKSKGGKAMTRTSRFSLSILLAFFTVFLISSTAHSAVAYRSSSAAATAESGNVTVDMPAGTVQNDIMIMVIVSRDNVTVTLPAGWTKLYEQTNTNQTPNTRGTLAWKRAGAGETGPYTVTHSGGDDITAAIASFSGALTSANPIDVSSWRSNNSSSTVTANGITTTVAETMIIFTSHFGDNRTHSGWACTDPASLTEAFDYTFNGSADDAVALAYATKATAGATGNCTATTTAAWDGLAGLIALKPEPTPGTLQFTSSTFTVAENGGSASVTVSRTGGSSGAASVTCATVAGGTATAGADYTTTSTVLSWADGDAANKTCSIPITNDTIDENDETVNLSLSGATGASLGTPNTATLTITDDDAPPTVQWTSASQASAGESGTMTVTAQLSAISGLTVTVPFTVSGTATGGGTDYTITASPITINAGSTTGTATITIVSDTLDENNETVILTIGTPTNATKGATDVHTATITDDDAPPTVQWTSASQASAGESGTMTVTAQLSAISGLTVTVPFTVSGTATGGGTDYTITASPITINAGSTTGTATITIVDDALVEGNETVILAIGTPTNATKGATDVHTATITDDDAGSAGTLQFSSATYTVAENGVTATITVTRTGGSTGAASVNYATSNGTATAGSDYTAASGTLNWADGDSANKTFNVSITNDAIDEDDETVNLTLSGATGATLGTPSTATLTITDDDSPPTVQFSSASSSGGEGTTPAVIAVTLSAQSGKTVSVNYSTADGTATAGADYTATSGTLNFAPGVTSQNINVPITEDAAVEGSETFTVTLSGPSNATLGTPSIHTYTILDNDGGGIPSLSSGGVNPLSGGTSTNFSFTVVYTDAENDAPAPGNPKIYLGDNDGFFGYSMTLDSNAAAALRDGNYTNGEQYVFTVSPGAALDMRYYFEAQAATGNTTVVTLPAGAPASYSTGPSVYLFYSQNVVGIPKDLGAGIPYSSILADDSGYSWCQRWNSTGLDTGPDQHSGSYVNCAGGNIVAGRSYFIWSSIGSTWRLDERNAGGTDLAGNIAAASFDIDLQVGWNMISNPYTLRIPLNAASGPRCTVVRNGVESASFAAAVASGWIDNSIHEWQAPATGYTGLVYNGTPAAVLEPWKGYWIYVPDNTFTTMKLRVYR